MVVKPAISVARRWLTARAVRSARPSCATWSFHGVSLYGWSRTCEWASTSPGMSVVPGRSMTFAPAAATLAAGPAASMRLPFTRTAQPSCSVSPSKTRAGLSTVTAAASRAAGGCADPGERREREHEGDEERSLFAHPRIIVNSACGHAGTQSATARRAPGVPSEGRAPRDSEMP